MCDGIGTCTHPTFPDGTGCDDGHPCTDTDICTGGVCAGAPIPDCVECEFGFECDDANDCTDEECNAGVCANPPFFAGTACGNQTSEGACDNPDVCDGAGTCDPNYKPGTTECNASTDECDPAESCTGTLPDCPADVFTPNGTACTDDGNECTDDVCSGGVCSHPDLPSGTACGDPTDDDCTNSDTCNGAGACLDNHETSGTACTDDGSDCSDDICDGSGACTHPNLVVGTACGDPADDDCTNPDTCDGAGTCVDNHEADGTTCTDDGNDCTDDVCASGGCTHPNLSAGAGCGDPTNDDCTNPDTCDGAGVCLDNHETDGTACPDDGNDCTDDVCATGACTHPSLAAGAACGDPLDDDCTNPDTCDGAGTCLDNHETDGTACTDDGNECTDDVCATGVCTHPDHPAGTACGDPANGDCTNPDACDGAGACLDNHETDGTTCTDDGNVCTNDECLVGVCVHPDNTDPCSDGDPCTEDDTCSGGVCSGTFIPGCEGCVDNIDCDDGDDCTENVCSGGACIYPDSAAGTACGDPTVTDCTNADTCDGAGTCLANDILSGTACTDDGNDCTIDMCTAGICIHPNLAAGVACGDQTDNDCTNPDSCNGAGTCLANDESVGTTCTDDGSECTVDICDGVGTCIHPNLADGMACTDDANDCTDDFCSAGICTHPDLAAGTACGDPIDSDCTDADTCDGAGTCLANDESSGTGCTDDGIECTDDVCDGSGACTHPDRIAGTACGDPTDNDCTNPDTCDGAGACLVNDESSGIACTDDGNECTDDTCDGSGLCTHPNLGSGATCGDPTDNDCTNPDTCDGAGTCLGNHELNGTACTDDGNICTDDVCDGTGACTHPNLPDGTDCDDATFCNGTESCSSGVCGSSGDPCTPLLCDEGGDVCIPAPHIVDLEVFYAGKFSDEADSTPQFFAAGTTSTSGNYTNYVFGITGFRVFFNTTVDFTTTPAAAFAFEWTTGTGATFSPVSDVTTAISVTSAVVDSATVVTVVINDDHVRRRWLKITIDSTQVTDGGVALDAEMTGNPVVLPSGEGAPGGDAVFVIGNLPGDVNGDRKILLSDPGLIRPQVNPFLFVPVTNIYDVDKDGKVLLTDVGETRTEVNPFFTLPTISP